MNLRFWPTRLQRKLWREIVQMRDREKYHLNCAEAFKVKKDALIKQYEALKRAK